MIQSMYVFLTKDKFLLAHSGKHGSYYRTHSQNYLNANVLTFEDMVDAEHALKHHIYPQLARTLTIKRLSWGLYDPV